MKNTTLIEIQNGYTYSGLKTGVEKSTKVVGDVKPEIHGIKSIVNNIAGVFGSNTKYKTDVVVEPNSIDIRNVYTTESIHYYENCSHITTSTYIERGTSNRGSSVIANVGDKFYGSGDFYQIKVRTNAEIGNKNISGGYTRSMKGSKSTSVDIEFEIVRKPLDLFDSSFRKYYSCKSNDDFDCNYARKAVVSKLNSMPTNADGSISDEQKDVVLSYIAPSYFA